MTWNTAAVEDTVEIVANGATYTRTVGENFRTAVLEVAQQAGFGKFTVRLNGSVIARPEDAPATIRPGDIIELEPYNVPGAQ